jgi:hypothetical protein
MGSDAAFMTHGVSISTLLETIIASVEVFEHIPATFALIQKVQKAILNLKGRNEVRVEDESLLGRLIRGQEEDLKRLIEEFNEIALRPDADRIEKESARRRLAAQACSLLKTLDGVLSQYIEDFQALKAFFCERVPAH